MKNQLAAASKWILFIYSEGLCSCSLCLLLLCLFYICWHVFDYFFHIYETLISPHSYYHSCIYSQTQSSSISCFISRSVSCRGLRPALILMSGHIITVWLDEEMSWPCSSSEDEPFCASPPSGQTLYLSFLDWFKLHEQLNLQDVCSYSSAGVKTAAFCRLLLFLYKTTEWRIQSQTFQLALSWQTVKTQRVCFCFLWLLLWPQAAGSDKLIKV